MNAQFEDSRLPARFWDKIEPCPMTGCWFWTGSRTQEGYGTFHWNRSPAYAHRVSRALLVSDVTVFQSSRNDRLGHLCGQTSCVNPAHLEPVSRRENILRGKAPSADNARKTCCPRCAGFGIIETQLAEPGTQVPCSCEAGQAVKFQLTLRRKILCKLQSRHEKEARAIFQDGFGGPR